MDDDDEEEDVYLYWWRVRVCGCVGDMLCNCWNKFVLQKENSHPRVDVVVIVDIVVAAVGQLRLNCRVE